MAAPPRAVATGPPDPLSGLAAALGAVEERLHVCAERPTRGRFVRAPADRAIPLITSHGPARSSADERFANSVARRGRPGRVQRWFGGRGGRTRVARVSGCGGGHRGVSSYEPITFSGGFPNGALRQSGARPWVMGQRNTVPIPVGCSVALLPSPHNPHHDPVPRIRKVATGDVERISSYLRRAQPPREVRPRLFPGERPVDYDGARDASDDALVDTPVRVVVFSGPTYAD